MSKAFADLVLVNGRILTAGPEWRPSQAMALGGGRVVLVGEDSEVKAVAGSRTVIRDLQGRTVIPGLVDAHTHLELFGYSWHIAVDCRPPAVKSITDIVDRLRARAGTLPTGEWVFGQGTHYQDAYLAERRYPDKRDLDLASTRHPVVFRSSYHLNVFNSKALQLLGANRETPDAPGGRIERDPRTGELTGRTFDMYDALGGPEAPLEQVLAGIEYSQRQYLEKGVTAVGDIPMHPGAVSALLALDEAHRLVIRVVAYPKLPTAVGLDELKTGHFARRFPSRPDMRLRLGGIKLFLDGGLTSSAAAMHAPYPGTDSYCGELAFTSAELDALVEAIDCAQLQVAIHAIGDRALDMAIAALGRVRQVGKAGAPRHRIEHAGNLFMTSPRVDALARLAITPVPQPSFIRTTAAGYREHLGAERTGTLMPFATLLKAGIPVPGSSDALGITRDQHDPLLGIWAAVTRETDDGAILEPEEAISVRDALTMYTKYAAYSIGAYDEIGSLEPGKHADFVVLSHDPMSIPLIRLREVTVQQTWIAGSQVYESS